MDCSVSIHVFKDVVRVKTLTTPDGTPWFVAKDVAEALGYVRPRDAVDRHTTDGVSVAEFIKLWSAAFHGATHSGRINLDLNPQTILIPESDVYALIFGSKLETAKEFKKWVTSVVLPTLRKNGVYSVGEEYLSDKV